MKRVFRVALAVLCASFVVSFAGAVLEDRSLDSLRLPWHATARHSAGIAPDPAQMAGVAIVQVYAAPTAGWRGLFAQHPWIIFKRAGQTQFTRYDVTGWRSGNHVRRNLGLPDGLWYGRRPHLLADHRGQGAEAMIDRIEAAIENYPYADTYRIYPGPNSNTFIAHVARSVPELKLDLPASAIGKDYRPIDDPVGLSPTGSGVQLSILGLLGVSVGLEEGVEFNVLGLDFGIDLNSPGLRLPFIGRLGMDDVSISGPE